MDLPEKVCKLYVMHDHSFGLAFLWGSFAIPKPFLLIPLVQLLQPTRTMYFYTKVPPPPGGKTAWNSVWGSVWLGGRVATCHSAVCVGVWKPRSRMNKAWYGRQREAGRTEGRTSSASVFWWRQTSRRPLKFNGCRESVWVRVGGFSVLWFHRDEKQWDVTGMLIMSAAGLVCATPGSRWASGSRWEVTNQRFLLVALTFPESWGFSCLLTLTASIDINTSQQSLLCGSLQCLLFLQFLVTFLLFVPFFHPKLLSELKTRTNLW